MIGNIKCYLIVFNRKGGEKVMFTKKIYVRPVVVGCYGKDGCSIPSSCEEKKESKECLVKAKKAKLVK